MLCESKVGNLDVSVRTEEDVLGFEVSVDDVERVEVVESQRNLSCEEFGDWIRESLRRGWSETD